MLELFDKSNKVRRFLWAVLILSFIFAMTCVLPTLIKTLTQI